MNRFRSPDGIFIVLVVVITLALTACGGGRTASSPIPAAIPSTGRAPGMKRQDIAALPLPARTLELSHVTSAAFARALGKDTGRIFEFVRDTIAYEAYAGVLRGPRGTLLALAGNSADRALLLGALLTGAGHQVRYARGTLPDADARDLVASMWMAPPAPSASPRTPGDTARGAVRDFVNAGKRDYSRVRDALKGAKTPGTRVAPAFDGLMAETRTHYWVQLAKDGAWVDLDPSFAEATMGKAYARLEETTPALPAALFHHVALRVIVEESDGTRSTTREVAAFSANAADLSGADVRLVHVPENWKGPVRNVPGAIAEALSDTGRIKPVLLVNGRSPVVGAPFRLKVKTTGASGVGSLLGGEGTRHPVEIATAEWIEFRFDYPDGHSETVVREVFDAVGKARRSRGQGLTQDELKALALRDEPVALRTRFFSIYFTTGRIDAAHLAGLPAGSSVATGPRTPVPLQRLPITFQVISDALLARVGAGERAVVRFYPDSPRVIISEFSIQGSRLRLSIDLRRDHARAVAAGPDPQAAFAAVVLRGVVDGTLERMITGYVAARIPGTVDLQREISTSLLFEQADAGRVPSILVTGERASLDPAIPEDVRTRLLEDVRGGTYALVPQRPITIGGTPRYAWWRIDPESGETVAVTDEGLHQTGTERMFVVEEGDGTFSVWVEVKAGGGGLPVAEGLGADALADIVFEALLEGFEVIGPL